jgi:integrase
MSRRKGQNPLVRVKKRASGEQVYYFQYWADLPGVEERRRRTEVVGVVGQITRSEAQRKTIDLIQKLEINSDDYLIPSSHTFADAVKHYRERFAPRRLRLSTISTAEARIKTHLEADWKDTPIEHVRIEAVNEWAERKREQGLSWTTIKDSLRTMQRVLSAFSKDKRVPFSMAALEIPERDKLAMRIKSRRKVSYSWKQAEQIAAHLRTMVSLGAARSEQYATIVLLAAASGLRCSELLALRVNDLNFTASTVRVDEASDQRSAGNIGQCKNAAAYRTVVLLDAEGRNVMRSLRQYLGNATDPDALVFRSKRGGPLLETTILSQGLHPALEALGMERSGLHAFRRGCNRRWELAGINPAVIRQQMGHTSATMTQLYSGEIPPEDVAAAFSIRFGNKIDVLEIMETEAAA